MEKANHSAAQRWWRSLADDVTVAQAQALLDEFCEQITDQRLCVDPDGNRCTVVDLAAAEPLLPVPVTPPIAVVTVDRKVSAQASVAFRGNTYSVPPAHTGQIVQVSYRLGAATLSIITTAGVSTAVHARKPDGAGVSVRTEQHVTALNAAALLSFTAAAPHRSKQRIPPGPAAREAANTLRGNNAVHPTGPVSASVTDLTRYARAAERRRTLP